LTSPVPPPPRDTVVVCLKWVATRPEIDPLSGAVRTDDRFSDISPADKAALEWALRIAEAEGLAVRAVTVGPTAADAGLLQAQALGATTTRVRASGNGRGTSRSVAAALAAVAGQAQLVFCGDHSLDRGSGSVPGFLANTLGHGQVLGCVGLKIGSVARAAGAGTGFVAERRLDQGRRELLAIEGPTVISFEGGLALRRAPLAATMAVSEADIDVRDAPIGDEAEPDPPAVIGVGPYRPRPRILNPPRGSTSERVRLLTGAGQEQPPSQRLELDPPAAAQAAIEQLRAWGYLEAQDRPGRPTTIDGEEPR